MKNWKAFRIKEVKEARTNSNGAKASLYFPQVKRWFGLFTNIKPSELKDEQYTGKVIQFRDVDNAYRFINDLMFDIKKLNTAPPVKQSKVVYHEVNAR